MNIEQTTSSNTSCANCADCTAREIKQNELETRNIMKFLSQSVAQKEADQLKIASVAVSWVLMQKALSKLPAAKAAALQASIYHRVCAVIASELSEFAQKEETAEAHEMRTNFVQFIVHLGDLLRDSAFAHSTSESQPSV